MSFSNEVVEYEDDDGFHFDPTDEEVIKFYLIPKLQNKLSERENFIVTKDVYSVEPWLLEHHNHPIFMENQWYYFVTRTQVSNNKTGCGKNTKRGVVGNRGSWNASKKEDIKDEVTGEIIGIKQTLKFIKNSNKRQKIGRDVASDDHVPGSEGSWIMKEFALPEGDKFQELVLCRIQKKKDKHDHHVYYSSDQINNNHEIVNQGQSFDFIGKASTSTNNHHVESSSSKEHDQPIDQGRESSCSTPAKQSTTTGEGNIIPMVMVSERCENPLNTPLSHEYSSIDVGDINWDDISFDF